MYACNMCGKKEEELTYLSIYITGSEGIDVCLECRMHITTFVRSMIYARANGYKDGYNRGKKQCDKREQSVDHGKQDRKSVV